MTRTCLKSVEQTSPLQTVVPHVQWSDTHSPASGRDEKLHPNPGIGKGTALVGPPDWGTRTANAEHLEGPNNHCSKSVLPGS